MNTFNVCAPITESESWHDINWAKCEASVRKLQARIVKATQQKRWNRVKYLQHLLTNSFAAKAIAVRRVTQNQGSRTAGVDGEKWTTPKQKMEATLNLGIKGYKPSPLKRIYIPKANGKRRPLGIPTMKDRAMQALFLSALEPIAETQADHNSYGFRKGRSAQDAAAKLHMNLSKGKSARWILEADIKACFDNISHDWLLDNVPMKRDILQKWLNAGFFEGSNFYPTEAGTPQGGIISPTLANFALDGLERLLATHFGKPDSPKRKRSKINLVRYADDFVITGVSKEILENEVLPVVKKFLDTRGMVLSQEKTRITHITDGFDFLGWNFRKFERNGKETFLTRPSKDSVNAILHKVKEVLRANRQTPQLKVIQILNPILRGWANYHRWNCASETFAKVDYLIWKKLWVWARRRHPRKIDSWISSNYFHKIGTTTRAFSAPTGEIRGSVEWKLSLMEIRRVKIKRHVKIRAEANPFDPEWDDYFFARMASKMKSGAAGRKAVTKLWLDQNGLCPRCGTLITKETGWHVHHVEGRKVENSNSYQNLTLIHPNCHWSAHAKKEKVLKPGVSEETLLSA